MEETSPQSELILRIGNESNPVDGVFGPLTYGLLGSHTFENQFTIEATYIRLHEPGTPTFVSVLDEAQLTFKTPETQILYGPMVVGVTAWKNRMIDMYTNLGGLEFTRSGKFSLLLGLYLGTATREDISKRFTGGQIGVSTTLGPTQVSASYMPGMIEDGSYRKIALEASTDVFKSKKMPLSLTFSLEDRYFDFGNGGPQSDPKDEFIFVTAAEIHLGE